MIQLHKAVGASRQDMKFGFWSYV